METYRRALRIDEWELIRERLIELRDKEGSDFIKLADPSIAIKHIVSASFRDNVVIFYDKDELIGILIFTLDKPWWADIKILAEILVLCVSPSFKGFARYAIDTLEKLGEEFKADAICAGCYFQKKPTIVSNSYIKKGFTLMCPTYVKLRGD